MFKKGDAVCWISDWDRKGTVHIVRAIVHSCGKKQMVLTNAETGKELGRHFYPHELQSWGYGFQTETCAIVTLVSDKAEVEALALSLAERIYERENAEYERRIANTPEHEAYFRKQQALLHAPDCFWGEWRPTD